MKTLILETSTEKSAAFLTVGAELCAVKLLPGGPDLSKQLASKVKDLLDRSSFQPEKIAIGQGPGSYTGIRVGAALAKGLAFGWKIPLVGFCSLKAFIPPTDGPFASLIDARGGGVYVLKGIKKGSSCSFDEKPFLLPTSEARQALKEIPHFSSPHPSLLEEKLGLEGLWFETPPQGGFLARLVEEGGIEEDFELLYLSSP